MTGMSQGRAIRLLVLWTLLLTAAVRAQNQTPSEVPPPPESPRLDSPRDTLGTFLDAMVRINAGDTSASPLVAACMDTRLVNGTNLVGTAQQLYDIFDRLGGIDLADLPGSDAIAYQTATIGHPVTRYELFPRKQHAWVWEKLKEPPDGKIVLVADAGGQWRFDQPTVLGIGRLYDSVKFLPPRGQGMTINGDEGEPVITLLGPTFDRTPWWGWAMLLLSIFLGLVAGKLVQASLRSAADRLEKHQWPARAAMFRHVMSPASLALLTTGVLLGMRLIHLEPAIAQFAQRVIAFLYLVAIAWALYNLVDVVEIALRNVVDMTDTKLDDMILPLVRKSLRIFLIIVFTLVVAQNVFGLNITGWLAGLGIAGLAVSLAAQDSIKNLFGSITVLLDKPFAVGDYIAFDGQEAKVEEIGFRSTKMRTFDGHVITVPNMKFIDGTVRNVTERRTIRRVLDVTITYDTPLEKIEQAVQIVKDILAEPQFTEAFDLRENPPRVHFNDYNATSLNIRVFYWFLLSDGRGWWDYNDHAHRFNLRLLQDFTDAGIDFAFPTQTLYLAGDAKRPLQGISDPLRGRPA